MGGSNHYCKHLSNSNWCHSQLCPLYRGCPLVGGSIIGGSTVYYSRIPMVKKRGHGYEAACTSVYMQW